MTKKIGFGFGSLMFALTAYSGCSPSGNSDFEFSNSHQESQQDNGTQLNGMHLNGMHLNGMHLNGMHLNGMHLNGTVLNVADITSGVITAVSADDPGITFDSSQLSSTIVDASMDDGSIVQYRIDSVVANPSIGTDLYYLSSLDSTSGVWSPACGIDTTGTYAPINTVIPAIALADSWNLVNGQNVSDPNLFTFSCVNAAIGKCVVWGYKRWATQDECITPGNCQTRDLAFFHQACTRLVRADYCGNGQYHTRNGTSIDVYDSLNIQSPANPDGYTLEAEWRYDGAHCINHTSWLKADATQDTSYTTDLAYVQATCPARLASGDPTCADPSASHFFTANGFTDSLDSRSVLRNASYLHQ